jgi:hypothetical protein
MISRLFQRILVIGVFGCLLAVLTLLDVVQTSIGANTPVNEALAAGTPQQDRCNRFNPDCAAIFLPLVQRNPQQRYGPFDFVGQFRATFTSSMAISGTTVYLQGSFNTASLLAIDTADPSSPRQIGQSSYDPGNNIQTGGTSLVGEKTRPEDEHWIILSGDLVINDIRDPQTFAAPTLAALSGGVNDHHVNGNLAYAITHHYSFADPPYLEVYDLSVPGQPRLVTKQEFLSGYGEYPRSMYVQDGLLYVGGSAQVIYPGKTYSQPTTALIIFKVEDGISRLGHVGIINDNPHDGVINVVTVDRGIAYVGETEGRVHAIDVSDPQAPRLLGKYNAVRGVEAFAVSGDILYIVAGAGGLHVVDVSDPAAPRRLALYQGNGAGAIHDVVVKDDLIYLGTSNGLQIIRYRPDE